MHIDMHDNKHSDMRNDMHGNMHSDMHSDIYSDMHHDVRTRIRNDMHIDMHNDLHNKDGTHTEMPNDMRPRRGWVCILDAFPSCMHVNWFCGSGPTINGPTINADAPPSMQRTRPTRRCVRVCVCVRASVCACVCAVRAVRSVCAYIVAFTRACTPC